MKALILVDLQNDFCPGGALGVDGGDEVIAVANKLSASDFFDVVVATQDWHPGDHGSFASNQGAEVFTTGELNGLPQVWWPDHCIWSSPGSQFRHDFSLNRVNAIFRKGMDKDIDSYSGFFDNGKRRSTGLGEYLRGLGVVDVYIMGLALDFCVKFTALDAAELGFNTHLVRDGCRAVNMAPGDDEKAVEELKAAGVTVVSSDGEVDGESIVGDCGC